MVLRLLSSVCATRKSSIYTLFSTDFGRTDLATGNMAQLYYSITEKLFKLPDDVAVYPGHEEDTVLGVEKERNSIWLYKSYFE